MTCQNILLASLKSPNTFCEITMGISIRYQPGGGGRGALCTGVPARSKPYPPQEECFSGVTPTTSQLNPPGGVEDAAYPGPARSTPPPAGANSLKKKPAGVLVDLDGGLGILTRFEWSNFSPQIYFTCGV